MPATAAALPARTFGIELELIMPAGRDRDALAAALRAAGVSADAPGYSHRVSAGWRVLTDGSLSGNGAEIVSPILRGEAGIAEARTVARAAEAFGCTVNVSCGFHVHVGAGDFSPAEIAKTGLAFMWFETFFDHIMPPSRRGDHNTYVKSNRSAFSGYGTEALNRAFDTIGASAYPTPAAAVDAVVNGRRHCGYHSAGPCRYFKLNLTPFVGVQGRPAYNTVEFRQHSGTVEADKVEHWVRLCVAFVEKAKVCRVRRRTVTRDLTAQEEMAQFFAMFPLPAETRAFYQARRKAIADADTGREARRAAKEARAAERAAARAARMAA